MWTGRAGVQVDTLVMHYAVDGDDWERDEDESATFRAVTPAVDCYDVAKLFASEKRGASAHFVLGRDGSLAQGVALDDTAWHAGGGALPDEGVGPLERPRAYLVNRRSIGIELCNAGWAADRIGVPKEYIREAIHPANARRRKVQRWEVFRDAQYEVLDELLAMMRPHFVVDRPVFVLGHEDVVNRDTLSAKAGRPVNGGKVDPGPLWDWTRNSWERFGFRPLRYDYTARAWVDRETTR
jgi:N-acetyl-anhydromuramyl-L-alanine amidase AmpD